MSRHIRTPRLDLIPGTLEIFRADLNDHKELARLLDAEVPGTWPPGEIDGEVLREFARMEKEGTDPFFTSWYWVLDTQNSRILVGSGGIGSALDDRGAVMIGYAVHVEHQNCGYATEAVAGIVKTAFGDPRITRVRATTYPELGASIRVLEKNGFSCTGPTPPGKGLEEGTFGFVLEKKDKPSKKSAGS